MYIGEPGLDVESKAPALTSTSCDANGQIGSLVVVPTGSESGQVGIRVVAGLTRNPEDCSAANYDGCIVARRTLEYLPHESQTVVIDLTADCAGNGCDVNHTCVEGACTDTVVAAPPIAPDGGVFVATGPDASIATDSSVAFDASGPTVRCGDDGTRCPASDPNLVCCVKAQYVGEDDGGLGPSLGSCVAPKDCDSKSATLFCDDTSDCSQVGIDAGDMNVCCESVQTLQGNPMLTTAIGICTPLSTCNFQQGERLVLCQDRGLCPSSAFSCEQDENLEGYFDCRSQ